MVIAIIVTAYHFHFLDLGFEISLKKEGAIEKGDIDIEIGDWGTCVPL